mgnify:CR=1 FL=1
MKKLTVVGMGPGEYESMTLRAVKALNTCDVIVGYTVYVDLAKPYFPDKEFLTTPMKREIERCEMAFAEAEKGRSVAMICSGDAGVYGMAGPILELGEKHPEVEIEVIPGITAALSGGAVLGAPLMHDFAVISLSDLLTPWEQIEERLEAAAKAGFVICLYNPSSKKRADYLQKACDIFLKYRRPDTICGFVKNIGREGETYQILPLEILRETAVDMFTTVYIGTEKTMELNGKMVTPRGYREMKKEKA